MNKTLREKIVAQDKKCIICGNEVLRKKKYSQKQWDLVTTCSNKCKAILVGKKRKGTKMSEICKKKISKANKGRKPYEMTDTIRKKISDSVKKNENVSISKRGCLNPQWRGGISSIKIKYSEQWTRTLRRAIRERDNYTCKVCGKAQEDRAFCVHHIDYNKLNCSPDNLITLCGKCHIATNSNRDKWEEYFKIC
jgi:hypothetical protein